MDYCFALSERKIALVDHQSRVASLYDAAERCVTTVATVGPHGGGAFRWQWNRSPIYLPVAGEEDDGVYVIEGAPEPEPDHAGDTIDSSSRFQALVRRRNNGWRCDELPPPPYVRDAVYNKPTAIDSCMLHESVIWLSTEGIGAYCFDTASRAWSKDDAAGTLPFSGKIERVPELRALVGFLRLSDGEDPKDTYRLCAYNDGLSSAAAADSGHRRLQWPYDTLEHLRPPVEWRAWKRAQLVSLGSGRFCVVQFFVRGFEKRFCHWCHHNEREERFAVFTGVEVVRSGEYDGEDEPGSGSSEWEWRPRLLKHKSKRYMLLDGNTIEFVL